MFAPASLPSRLLRLFAPLLACAAFVRADVALPAKKTVFYTEDRHPSRTYDLYLPAPSSDGKPAPLCVWIHGGAWKYADKNWNNLKYLVAQGYALASIDYRLSNEAVFPAQIQDCNLALDHLLAHAAENNIDSRRVFIGGASAGGHLALLLGFAREQKEFGAAPAFRPFAIIDFFGPTDLTGPHPRGSSREALLGGPGHDELGRLASPLNHVGGARCPVLIFHGSDDELVPVAQSEKLDAALRAAGVPVKLVVVPDTGHDGPNFETPPMQRIVLDFLREAEARRGEPVDPLR